MELSSCYDARSIQVYVTCIGSNSQYRQHYRAVSALNEIPLYDINLPSDWKAQSIFPSATWDKGALHFEYSNPNDVKPTFALKTKLKSPLMVIGLINFPEFVGPGIAYDDDIRRFLSENGAVAILRIFVFNFNFDATDNYTVIDRLKVIVGELRVDPDIISIVPPGGSCEGGSKVNLHIALVMSVASARVLEVIASRIDRLMKAPDVNVNAHICPGDYFLQACSPLDALKAFSLSINLLRMKVQVVSSDHLRASLDKQSQMTSFQNRQYETTLASRLEGFAAAAELVTQLGLLTEPVLNSPELNFKHLVQAAGYEYSEIGSKSSLTSRVNAALNFRKKSNTNDNVDNEVISFHEKILNEVMGNMLLEALALYSEPLVADPIPVAESRCSLKLAAKLANDLMLLEVLGSGDDSLVAADKTENIGDLKFLLLTQIWEFVMRGTGLEGLSPTERVTSLVMASQICTKANLQRKAGFLMYIAGLVAQQGAALSPYVLLQSSRDVYLGDSPLDSANPQGQIVKTVTSSHLWMKIQRLLLANCVFVAMEDAGASSLGVTNQLCQLLRYIGAAEDWIITNLYPYLAHLPFKKDRSVARLDFDDAQDSRTIVVDPVQRALAIRMSLLSKRMIHGREGVLVKAEVATSARSLLHTPTKSLSNETAESVSPFRPPEYTPPRSTSKSSLGPTNDSIRSELSASAALSTRSPLKSSSSLLNITGNGQKGSIKAVSKIISTSPFNRFQAGNVNGNGVVHVSPNHRQWSSRFGLSNISVLDPLALFSEDNRQSKPVTTEITKLNGSDGSKHQMTLHPSKSINTNNGRCNDISNLSELLASLCPTVEEQDEGMALLQELTSTLTSSPTNLHLPILFCAASIDTEIDISHKVSEIDLKTYKQVILRGIYESTSNSAASFKGLNIETATADQHSSSLFYDPFAARKNQSDRKSDAEKLAVWCVDHVCHVSTVLSNPFSVPITFTNVQPVFSTLSEGADTADVLYELYDQPVILPPNTLEFKLTLKVKPLSQGMISLHGLKFVMNKAEDIVLLDENGCFCDNPLPLPWSYYNSQFKRHSMGHQSRVGNRVVRFMQTFPLKVRIIGPRLKFYPTVVPSLPPKVSKATAVKNDANKFEINFESNVTDIPQTQHLNITWNTDSNSSVLSVVKSWRLIVTQNINGVETKIVLVNFSGPLACASNAINKSSTNSLYCSLLKCSQNEDNAESCSKVFCCVVAVNIVEGLRSLQFDLDAVSLNDLQQFSANYAFNFNAQRNGLVTVKNQPDPTNWNESSFDIPCDDLYFQRTSLLIRMNSLRS